LLSGERNSRRAVSRASTADAGRHGRPGGSACPWHRGRGPTPDAPGGSSPWSSDVAKATGRDCTLGTPRQASGLQVAGVAAVLVVFPGGAGGLLPVRGEGAAGQLVQAADGPVRGVSWSRRLISVLATVSLRDHVREFNCSGRRRGAAGLRPSRRRLAGLVSLLRRHVAANQLAARGLLVRGRMPWAPVLKQDLSMRGGVRRDH
jgi:hypothetical protein